ncbi:MAG: hypothetical protein FD166_54 [Bacteroidetes bacterium]|nr:MAG: hypothetical protein FD166_54 [Bacteroidota bacterium]
MMGKLLQIIRNSKLGQKMNWTEKMAAGNSTYKKLAFQRLNEVLCFVASSVLANSFVLRNRQLQLAAKRHLQG